MNTQSILQSIWKAIRAFELDEDTHDHYDRLLEVSKILKVEPLDNRTALAMAHDGNYFNEAFTDLFPNDLKAARKARPITDGCK